MAGLSLDQAVAVLVRAQQVAAEMGIPMSFAIVDPGGHLLALHRMDGAPWISADVATGKAFTAAAYGAPSAAQAVKMRDLPVFSAAISAATGGRFTPQDGGLPVTLDGALVGGMGASGGTGQQDEAVVRQALAALEPAT